jgi:hypothetical protein
MRSPLKEIKEGDWVWTPRFEGYNTGQVKILKPPYARVELRHLRRDFARADSKPRETIFRIDDLKLY